MNAEPGTAERGRARDRSTSLDQALEACFGAETSARAFAGSFARLAAELTGAPRTFVFGPGEDGPDVLATVPKGPPDQTARALAAALLDPDEADAVRHAPPWLGTRIAVPRGGAAAAVLELPRGAAAQSLAHERLTLLSALSRRQYSHPDLGDLEALMREAAAVPGGDPERLRAFADTLNRLCGADHVAVGLFDGASVVRVVVSGQAAMTTRAALPDQLRREMKKTALEGLSTPERAFAPWRSGEGGVVLHIEAPQRNRGLVPLVVAALSLASPRGRRRGPSRHALMRTAALLLVLVAVAALPVPDAIKVPAEVRAVDRRVVTAPFTGVLREVRVADNQGVAVDDGPLVTLDTQEFDIELIAARSDYSSAVLERESARAARDAGALRKAELEAERLRANIDLLELKRASAEVAAPISGIVAAPGLSEREGTTVSLGDALFEVSDPSHLELELAIPEKMIGRLEDGASGEFRPDYDPTLRLESRITRISPAQSEEQETPVFLGDATLPLTDALRPGMRGVLAIDRPTRAVWKVVWEGARDWVLLRLWF